MPRHYPRRWWSRHTVIQSGKHLKIFVMKRVQRCPFSRANKKKTMAPFSIWSSLSQCGRTCVRFQHNTADDKIAYEKRQMAAVTLLGGPTSTWHIEPVNDYFCISQQFFFFLVELDWYIGPLNISHDVLLWYEVSPCQKIVVLFCAFV